MAVEDERVCNEAVALFELNVDSDFQQHRGVAVDSSLGVQQVREPTRNHQRQGD